MGRGMACGFWFNFGGQTCVDMNVTPDGNVTVAVGTIDVGGSRASLAMAVAEELGVKYDNVRVHRGGYLFTWPQRHDRRFTRHLLFVHGGC